MRMVLVVGLAAATASAPRVAEEPTPAVAKRTCGMVRKANGAMKLAPC